MRSQTLLLADTICQELDDAEALLLKRQRQITKDPTDFSEECGDIDPSTVEDYRNVFDMFDEDANGFVDFSELGELFKKLGQEMSEDELNDIMASVDTDSVSE
jgi:Ca2+-binding EF-hand superfamily protein